MDQYRKDVQKLYERIIRIVSKGESYVQNYYDLIDEVVDNGKSVILQDVMITKFKIDTTTYASIDNFKKNTFKKISNFTESSSNLSLTSLYKSRGVYTIGTQFFDIVTSQYIGDIKQFDSGTISQGLEIYTFFPDYMRVGIPKFNTSPLITLNYKKGNIVYYGPKLYQCNSDYVWNKFNQITPTFSSYWFEIYPGTQSLQSVTDQKITLIDRYNNSIDILRKYNYVDYSSNKYIESNYIDEYFE